MKNVRITIIFFLIALPFSNFLYAVTAKTHTVKGDCSSNDKKKQFRQKVYTDLGGDGAYEYYTITWCNGKTRTYEVKPPVRFNIIEDNPNVELYEKMNESHFSYIIKFGQYEVPAYIEIKDTTNDYVGIFPFLDEWDAHQIYDSIGIEEVRLKAHTVLHNNTLYVAHYISDVSYEVSLSILCNENSSYNYDSQVYTLLENGWNIFKFENLNLTNPINTYNYTFWIIDESGNVKAAYNSKF